MSVDVRTSDAERMIGHSSRSSASSPVFQSQEKPGPRLTMRVRPSVSARAPLRSLRAWAGGGRRSATAIITAVIAAFSAAVAAAGRRRPVVASTRATAGGTAPAPAAHAARSAYVEKLAPLAKSRQSRPAVQEWATGKYLTTVGAEWG